MKTKGVGGFLERQVRISLLGLGILTILFFPSLVKVIPFLQIRHLALNIKDPKLAAIVREILKKKYANNYLLLYLNRGEFKKTLQKKTQFYIENVNALNFNWVSGRLYISLIDNKALAILNGKYFVSERGRIFGFKHFKVRRKIFDKTSPWHFGDIYTSLPTDLIKLFNTLIVSEYVVVGFTKGAKLTFPRGIKREELLKFLEKYPQEENLFIEANLLGTKGVYLKIIKGVDQWEKK